MADDVTTPGDGTSHARVSLRLGARTWQFDRPISDRTAGLLTVAVVLGVAFAVTGLLAVAAVVAWLIAQAV